MEQQNNDQSTNIENTQFSNESLYKIESSDLLTQPSPEYLQKKLYFLLEQLKVMHAALPE